MTNLIKVEHMVKDKRDWPDETMTNILREVFGDEFKLDYHKWQDIQFNSILIQTYSSWHNYPLKGIRMTVGTYGRRTIRKVMINKDGLIDSDAIKAKVTELKTVVAKLEQERKKSAEYQSRCQATLNRISKAVNHPERDWGYPVQLQPNNPETVKLEAEINGSQHQAIEQILGEQKIEIRLVVPEDKAVEIYNILKDKE